MKLTRGSISVIALIAAGTAFSTASIATTIDSKACNAQQTAGGMQTVYSESNSGKAIARCINTFVVNEGGGAITGVNTPKPKLDSEGKQVTIDGHPIVRWDSDSRGNPQAEVHGTNGVAVGAGAIVGEWVKPVSASSDYKAAYDEIIHHTQVGTPAYDELVSTPEGTSVVHHDARG